MKKTIWEGRQFDFEFSCEEQDIKNWIMEKLREAFRQLGVVIEDDEWEN